jgi:hypothetical protein
MMETNGSDRDECIIEIKVRDVEQLFNSMDPSPFIERDLDSEAEDFIIGWARELSGTNTYRLVLHLERYPELDDAVERIGVAIRNYFTYRAQMTARQFRHLMREGRLSLLIGLIFLSVCVLASKLTPSVDDGALMSLVGEGLIIAGWVAMWRPMEIFLYRWWPLVRHRQLLDALGRMEVEVSSSGR